MEAAFGFHSASAASDDEDDASVSAAAASGAARGSNDGIGGAGSSFECNICFELAQDPVVTLCGHLFCWPCLYKWLHIHAHFQECPVCKAPLDQDMLVPLYGRGKNSSAAGSDPRSRSATGLGSIPERPSGPRRRSGPVPPLPPPNTNQNHPNFVNGGGGEYPWGEMPMAGGARFGNYTFSAAIGGLFPYLNFQVHGFPETVAGFPYGYPTAFQGGHAAHGYHHHRHHHLQPPAQTDVYLKVLLVLLGALVVATLLFF